MNKNSFDSWKKFLTPELLRENLVLTGLFIASYETLKESIIEQPLSFYSLDFDDDGKPVVSEGYEKEVLSLDPKKNHLRASIKWLRKSGVINENDELLIDELREHRNEISHDLPKFLAQAGREVDIAKFGQILGLVTKIDRWWIINVELAIRDDINLTEVDVEKITSGRMMLLNLMIGNATGTEHADFNKAFLDALAEKSGEAKK